MNFKFDDDWYKPVITHTITFQLAEQKGTTVRAFSNVYYSLYTTIFATWPFLSTDTI